MLDLGVDGWDMQTATAEQLAEWRDAATYREPPVQVKLTIKGCWHRPLSTRGRTACGKALGGYATRDDSLLGDLCKDGCFSAYEFTLAAEERDRAAAEKRDRERQEDERDDELSRRRRATGEIDPRTKHR
jgi:hypothetical protein